MRVSNGLFLASLAAIGSCTEFTEAAKTSRHDVRNANHIFNAIHSSMRQFGSSLNHNGMSLFIAHVPEGTELYHGTHTSFRVNATEWLAFEPEHAMIFARPQRGGPGRGPPGHGPSKDGASAKSKQHDRPARSRKNGADKNDRSGRSSRTPKNHQVPLSSVDGTAEEGAAGYVHTYRTKHPLRLLYTDGQSAAKSSKGTLDVQDMVIANMTMNDGQHMSGEKQRADEFCRIAHEEWDDRIDGVLRMEGGFEIILCSFEKHLDVVRITQAIARVTGGGPNASPDDGFNYYRAVAARYDGIGDGRVTVDYQNMISLFDSHEAIYFDDTGRPRVRNDSISVASVRNDLTAMVMQTDTELVDWQAVIDMYITRYADRIEYLASGDLETEETLKDEVERALRPFIDYGSRDDKLETDRCASQFWPSDVDDTTLAARAIKQVLTNMCASLTSIRHIKGYNEALQALRGLKKELAWTTWKRCRGCRYDEVCFLPIWPVGKEEDFEQPKCRSGIALGRGRGEDEGYWESPGRPREGDPNHDSNHD